MKIIHKHIHYYLNINKINLLNFFIYYKLLFFFTQFNLNLYLNEIQLKKQVNKKLKINLYFFPFK